MAPDGRSRPGRTLARRSRCNIAQSRQDCAGQPAHAAGAAGISLVPGRRTEGGIHPSHRRVIHSSASPNVTHFLVILALSTVPRVAVGRSFRAPGTGALRVRRGHARRTDTPPITVQLPSAPAGGIGPGPQRRHVAARSSARADTGTNLRFLPEHQRELFHRGGIVPDLLSLLGVRFRPELGPQKALEPFGSGISRAVGSENSVTCGYPVFRCGVADPTPKVPR